MSTAVHHPGNRCIVSRMPEITQRTPAVLFTSFPSVTRQLMFLLTIFVRCLRCAVPVLPALSRTRRKGHLYPGIVQSGGETVRPTIITGLVVISWHERRLFNPAAPTKGTHSPMMHRAGNTTPPAAIYGRGFSKKSRFQLRLRRRCFGDTWWPTAELHRIKFKFKLLYYFITLLPRGGLCLQ